MSMASPGAAAGDAGIRILVVEDEPLIRMILAETLAEEGFRVIEAADGDEATALIDGSDRFDMVVTDIQMPGRLDGVAVGRHARQRDRDIKLVYVTGRPESLGGAAPLGIGDAIVRKPYGPREIVAVIRGLLAAPERRA